MNSKFFIFLLFFSLSLLGYATKINGFTFKPFQGKTVNLIQYKDYITKEYEILASTTVDTFGQFFFDYEIKETQQAIIQIEYLIGIIYLDPNQEYTIKFPPRSEDGTYKLSRNNVNIIFDSIPKNDINGLILEFNRLYDQFLVNNRYNIGKPYFHSNLDTFKLQIKKQFEGIDNDYFLKYARFSIGDLQLVAPSSHEKINKLSIYNSYIVNKKIDVKNHTQMNFLMNFYAKSLNNQLGQLGIALNNSLTTNPSYAAIDSILEKDYFFKMKQIRELVISENLFSMFYDEKYDPNVILSLLKEAKSTIESEELKLITNTIISSITKLTQGSPTKPIELIDKNGDSIDLKVFEGKYIYINFWAKWNKESLAEMDVIKKMKLEYGDIIEFVSINIDANKRNFDVYVASHPEYSWNMLYFGGDANLLDAFDIFTVPHYVLLDKKANILQAPALKPVPNGNFESIERTFFKLKQKSKQKPNFKIGTK
jgi:thiol-disulfide isomerase/thioredoxin